MKLHIVGGFLGSGKTTAINNAAKRLDSKSIKTGVITNDRYELPEETGIVRSNYNPAEQVISGCFSSNLDTLSDKIERLNQDTQSDYLFAESVGSCTDLVVTVVKPLMIFNNHIFESLTLSIFVDARMLLAYLKGDKLLFGDDVIYVFEKQIEEADLLVINKIDLLSDADFPELKRLVDNYLPGKNIITQNSFNNQNIDNWLDTLDGLPQRKRESLEIDYQSYSKGETDLTWLEEEINFNATKRDAGEYAIRFIEKVVSEIRQNQIPVGHIKFMLMDGDKTQKISFTAYSDDDWKMMLLPVSSGLVKLVMNARLETSQDNVNTIIQNCITSLSNNDVKITKSIPVTTGIPNPVPHSPIDFRCCEECICLKKLIARNDIRREDGSATALAELENEQFECLGVCSESESCCC